MKICDNIIEKAKCNEIIETLREKINKEVNGQNWVKICEAINNKQFQEIFLKYLPVCLAVSYDMDWQKGSTGRVYDSLSGHVFFVKCRSGKVSSRSVLQKNAQYVHHTYHETYLSQNMFVM